MSETASSGSSAKRNSALVERLIGPAEAVEIWVPGIARPKGSFKFVRGRARPSSKHVEGWQSEVSMLARIQWDGDPLPAPSAFGIASNFSVLASAKRAKWHPFSPSRGDIDKLARAICDALTGIVYEDDRQIVDLSCSLRYVPTEAECGASIRVWEVGYDDLFDEGSGVGGTA